MKVIFNLNKSVIQNPHDYQWYFANPQVVGKYSFLDEFKTYSRGSSPLKFRKTMTQTPESGSNENVTFFKKDSK
jgi:hypothetical protein